MVLLPICAPSPRGSLPCRCVSLYKDASHGISGPPNASMISSYFTTFAKPLFEQVSCIHGVWMERNFRGTLLWHRLQSCWEAWWLVTGALPRGHCPCGHTWLCPALSAYVL